MDAADKKYLANSKFHARKALLAKGDMYRFDPTGELHLQQKRAAKQREFRYMATWCALLLSIFALVLVMGGNQ